MRVVGGAGGHPGGQTNRWGELSGSTTQGAVASNQTELAAAAGVQLEKGFQLERHFLFLGSPAG